MVDKTTSKTAAAARNDDVIPLRETLEQLNKLATNKLHEIVNKQTSKGGLAEDIESELIAAKQLLDQDGATKF